MKLRLEPLTPEKLPAFRSLLGSTDFGGCFGGVWTGSGPKTAFPLLKTKLASRLSDFSEKIWTVGCMAVSATFRGTHQLYKRMGFTEAGVEKDGDHEIVLMNFSLDSQ